MTAEIPRFFHAKWRKILENFVFYPLEVGNFFAYTCNCQEEQDLLTVGKVGGGLPETVLTRFIRVVP